ncbi:S8 family serine peptidase [Flavivirga abyssicola]|uniref:S8 family serine peptidase n=1 Tax=Flavivirga abyssicola TaxID=3063533 RepID=UPI0026E026FF|nr:S8 family serine peptidase [Flavivirga sp. MEBiC07777]WVK12668.1 S8 family serine peptidase [Flavivirga sp. MEBiC07777]
MKVTVSKYLNVRVGEPRLDAPNYQYLAPGSILEVDGKLYNGQDYEGNSLWYKDLAGNYYWSGGILDPSFKPNIWEQFKIDKFWWFKDYNLDKVWKSSNKGSKIKVAILDTGLSLPHSDLDVNSITLQDVTDSDSTEDWTGHGTHVCGILNAAHNTKGVYGLAPNVDLYFAKVTNDIVGDSLDFLVKGIDWAVANSVDIISISKGFQNDSNLLKAAISRAAKSNILIVCAAGNKLHNTHVDIDFPARYSETISVGGILRNKKVLGDTINTNQTDIFAPGFEVLSTFKKNSYKKLSGSSQAAPFVAGLAALLLSKIRKNNPKFKAIDLKDHLLSTSDNQSFGKVVNPLNAINNTP